MLDIDEEKLPPPNPHNIAMATKCQYEVDVSCTAMPSQTDRGSPAAGRSRIIP